MMQSAHGDQINDMKKSTAYALLERMSRSGLVSVELLQEGNRPLRKVFSITAEGKKAIFHTFTQKSHALGFAD
ncbi:PadR family transcriptional regulator [Sulfoacidibacillus thermotolerans]|uniref:PadR family transcriptional regulator n=1 Tax=Sulfoacidibacillus thermotolerans TaxID=1765684 RepID=UPI000D695B05|nr:PadR family transcriptional regulator [Sulfoacidibacillus thermotolerans]